MDLFGQSKRKMSEEEMDEILSHVRFFPGSLKEYRDHVGYPVSIIDLQKRDLGIEFTIRYITGNIISSLSVRDKALLIDNGIEALVNCSRFPEYYYGLPVAKKKK